MNIRHPVLATLVGAAFALAFAATADANGPRGNPGVTLVTAAASAAAPRRAAPAQGTRSGAAQGPRHGAAQGTRHGAAQGTRQGAAQQTRPGAGQTARPGTSGAANPGQQPQPGMRHVKPGNNPNARVTFNLPATQGQAGAQRHAGAPRTTPGSATATRPNTAPRTTAGSATATRPNTTPRTTAGSATATRPNTAPRTTPGSTYATRPNTAPRATGSTYATGPTPAQSAVPAAGTSGAARNTRRDAGTWTPHTTADSATATRPNTAPRTNPGSTYARGPNTAQAGVPAAGSRTAPRDTRRDAGYRPSVNPVTPSNRALRTPSPAHAPTRKDARPPGATSSRPAASQPNIRQVKSSKNARGDGRVSTMGQGPKPAPDNSRQLADYMMVESTLQQQRAPRTPEE